MRRLLEESEQLPGIGPRTATRLVHHLLRQPAEKAKAFNCDKDKVAIEGVAGRATDLAKAR